MALYGYTFMTFMATHFAIFARQSIGSQVSHSASVETSHWTNTSPLPVRTQQQRDIQSDISDILKKFNPDLFGYSTGTGSANVWKVRGRAGTITNRRLSQFRRRSWIRPFRGRRRATSSDKLAIWSGEWRTIRRLGLSRIPDHRNPLFRWTSKTSGSSSTSSSAPTTSAIGATIPMWVSPFVKLHGAFYQISNRFFEIFR